jgi:hypothetical protein
MSFIKNVRFLAGICFVSLASASAFAIMNGRDADSFKSAQSISIFLKVSIKTASFGYKIRSFEGCTAVIVAHHLLLTAGHCLEGAKPVTSLDTSNGNISRTLHVTSWQAAPDYRPAVGGDEEGNRQTKSGYDIQQDIAYMVTSEDLVDVFHLQASQVPNLLGSIDQVKDWLATSNGVGVAYGFGDYSQWGSGRKKELQVRIQLQTVVQDFVVYSVEPERGQCSGDSGSGLFLERKLGQSAILIGILSGISMLNDDCAHIYNAVYANITPHICWIQSSSGISLGKTDCP